MRCLSCNREIEGEPEHCPGCGAVLDWPDRPVPRPPRGERGLRGWISTARRMLKRN